MQTMIRISAILLSMLCVLTFAACATEQPPADTTAADTTAAPASPATETTAPETTALSANLPADLDFEEKTVSIFVRDNMKKEFIATEVTGEVLNDALHMRNRKVEERLSVKLDYITSNAKWADYNNEVRRSVQGQTGEYQIVTNYAYYGAALAAEGIYLNLLELPHLDLSRPWWNGDFSAENTLADNLFFTVGDLTISTFDRAMVTFFNKEMVKSNFGELDLYAVVKEGKWTIDYLGELVKNTYNDLDGDTQNDLTDFHGVSFNLGSMCLDGMQVALGVDVTTRDADGMPQMALNSQHFIDAYDKLYNFIYRNSGVGYNPTTTTGYYGTMGSTYYASEKLFNRQAIFAFDILSDAKILRDFTDPYGVLPLPKYDENQTQYRTTPQDAYSIVSVPTTTVEHDMVGAVLESMAFESYSAVRPAYFEQTYKYRYLDAPADAEMFDLVIDNICYNFGILNSSALGDPGQTFRKQMMTGTESIAKVIAATDKMNAKKLKNLVEDLSELGK